MQAKSNIIKEDSTKFAWSNLRLYLIAIPLITAIISLLEFQPDWSFWSLEILRNLVLTICITMTIYLLCELLNLHNIQFRFLFLLKLLFTYVASGVIGGLIAWKINVWLFDFNITHPVFFLILTSSLSLIFGITIVSYASVLAKLKSTSAKLIAKEVAEERLKALKIQAELEALRAKVNPHFFFNTLNSIASLIGQNPDEAEKLIERVSHLFRYSLDTSNRDFVELGHEIEMTMEYLEIESIRLGKRMSYEIEYDKKLNSYKVPGMLIQPIVENSVKHGLSDMLEGGRIIIRCELDDDYIVIEVADNGKGFDTRLPMHGFGIRGIRERLSLLYGERASIDIRSETGCTVKMKFPIVEEWK